MSYTTGSANNLTDLRTALFNACVAEGWTLNSPVLTKGSLAVAITINETSSVENGIGLVVQGGTSSSGATLINPSINSGRLGPLAASGDQISWPVTYEIFIHSNPDEVYLVINTAVDMYLWLAFGGSNVPGIGVWGAGSARRGAGPATNGVILFVQTSSFTAGGSNASAPLLFSSTQQSIATGTGPRQNDSFVHVDLDGITWAGNPSPQNTPNVGSYSAAEQSQTLLRVSPNDWNNEAVLLRIRPMMWRAGQKASIIVDVQHARYIRVDNYAPGQIIQLGEDYWKVFPAYRKNTSARNGGSGVNHSGTLGWAIRYDGPV